MQDISRRTGISRSVIADINRGTHTMCDRSLEYPIRQPFMRMSQDTLSKICAELKANKLQFCEIEAEYSISKSLLNRINQGKRGYRMEGIEYPIRKSSDRVYRTCRDYPGWDQE